MAMEAVPQNCFNREDKAWKFMAKAVDASENGVSGGFDCNICLETAQDPVVTLCGHLYCWPCIYKWIHHHNSSSENPHKLNSQCPICKSEVSQMTIVPLYGLGKTIAPGFEEKAPNLGMVIPRRPPTPRHGVLGAAQPRSSRGYQQRAPAPLPMPGRGGINMATGTSPSPTIGMLGELVSGRILGDLQTPLFPTPNSYNLAGISTRRTRRQAMEADRSLSRIYAFFFCCVVMCLLLLV